MKKIIILRIKLDRRLVIFLNQYKSIFQLSSVIQVIINAIYWTEYCLKENNNLIKIDNYWTEYQIKTADRYIWEPIYKTITLKLEIHEVKRIKKIFDLNYVTGDYIVYCLNRLYIDYWDYLNGYKIYNKASRAIPQFPIHDNKKKT